MGEATAVFNRLNIHLLKLRNILLTTIRKSFIYFFIDLILRKSLREAKIWSEG